MYRRTHVRIRSTKDLGSPVGPFHNHFYGKHWDFKLKTNILSLVVCIPLGRFATA